MAASATARIGVHGGAIPRWILGQNTARAFVGIVFLAALSFIGSAVVLDRTLDARDRVQHSREVQLQIDRMVWDLMRLQQARQSHALNPAGDATEGFVQLRDEVRGDLAETARVTADNLYQQQ